MSKEIFFKLMRLAFDGIYVKAKHFNLYKFTPAKVLYLSNPLTWMTVRELLEVYYPKVKKIRLVMDNLNTHTVSSLYEAFTPNIARSLAKRLEIHYTPKHGSWLNIAEIELSVMSIQCLERRISSIDSLSLELSVWETAYSGVIRPPIPGTFGR